MSTKSKRPPPRRGFTASPAESASGSRIRANLNNTSESKDVVFDNGHGMNHKRKEREDRSPSERIHSKSSATMQTAVSAARPTNKTSRISDVAVPNGVGRKSGPNKGSDAGHPLPDPSGCQVLLAGYMAREFLSKGTLFGQVWDPTRLGSDPCNLNAPDSSDGRVKGPNYSAGDVAHPRSMAEQQKGMESEEEQEGRGRYQEVTNLLMSGEAHLPGIVNPTELGRFLQL